MPSRLVRSFTAEFELNGIDLAQDLLIGIDEMHLGLVPPATEVVGDVRGRHDRLLMRCRAWSPDLSRRNEVIIRLSLCFESVF